MDFEVMLTTIDNPFNPFDDFDSWFKFDIEKGYYSCSRLARVMNVNDEMTQKEIEEEKERAIDAIVMYDFLDIYKKLKRTIPND